MLLFVGSVVLVSQREMDNLGARGAGARFTVLYSHGNGEDLGLAVESLAHMARGIGANVFAYE